VKKSLLLLVVSLAVLSLIFTIGYANQSKEPGASTEEVQLEFEVLENLSWDLKKVVGFVKDLQGFGIIKQTDEEALIHIGLGEKPTGGYNISVKSVTKANDTTKIKVVEDSPKPEEMVTQAITYPHTVIKVSDVTDQVKVVNQQGEVYEDINDETKEAEHFDKQD
jgi:hypothetical protein